MVSKSDDMRGEKLTFDFLPLRRIGQPDEIAETVAWLLCDKSSYITGTVNNVDGGWWS